MVSPDILYTKVNNLCLWVSIEVARAPSDQLPSHPVLPRLYQTKPFSRVDTHLRVKV